MEFLDMAEMVKVAWGVGEAQGLLSNYLLEFSICGLRGRNIRLREDEL